MEKRSNVCTNVLHGLLNVGVVSRMEPDSGSSFNGENEGEKHFDSKSIFNQHFGAQHSEKI